MQLPAVHFRQHEIFITAPLSESTSTLPVTRLFAPEIAGIKDSILENQHLYLAPNIWAIILNGDKNHLLFWPHMSSLSTRDQFIYCLSSHLGLYSPTITGLTTLFEISTAIVCSCGVKIKILMHTTVNTCGESERAIVHTKWSHNAWTRFPLRLHFPIIVVGHNSGFWWKFSLFRPRGNHKLDRNSALSSTRFIWLLLWTERLRGDNRQMCAICSTYFDEETRILIGIRCLLYLVQSSKLSFRFVCKIQKVIANF